MPPMTEPQIPNAIARSLPWKLALTIERVEGRIMAAPMPCNERAAMRSPPVGACPASMLAATNVTRPAWKRRFRP